MQIDMRFSSSLHTLVSDSAAHLALRGTRISLFLRYVVTELAPPADVPG